MAMCRRSKAQEESALPHTRFPGHAPWVLQQVVERLLAGKDSRTTQAQSRLILIESGGCLDGVGGMIEGKELEGERVLKRKYEFITTRGGTFDQPIEVLTSLRLADAANECPEVPSVHGGFAGEVDPVGAKLLLHFEIAGEEVAHIKAGIRVREGSCVDYRGTQLRGSAKLEHINQHLLTKSPVDELWLLTIGGQVYIESFHPTRTLPKQPPTDHAAEKKLVI